MANDNKNKTTETAVQDAPKSEKSAPKSTVKSVQFPVLKDGRWVCSDGVWYKDAYLARQHQNKLK